jgi:hypothetical protein
MKKMCSLGATRISILITICARESSPSSHVSFCWCAKKPEYQRSHAQENGGQCSEVGPAPVQPPDGNAQPRTGRCDLACFASTPCSEAWPSSSHESQTMGSCTPPQHPGTWVMHRVQKILLCVTTTRLVSATNAMFVLRVAPRDFVSA